MVSYGVDYLLYTLWPVSVHPSSAGLVGRPAITWVDDVRWSFVAAEYKVCLYGCHDLRGSGRPFIFHNLGTIPIFIRCLGDGSIISMSPMSAKISGIM